MFWEILEDAGAVVFVVFFIGMCIFVHELGHFLAAKLRGVHIDAFSIGFRTVWHKTVNGIDYRIGWLPFGGYVELPQIDGSGEAPKTADGKPLPRATPMDRIVTAFCGPLFNILFGLLVGCAVWIVGIPQDSPKLREVVVQHIDPAGPEFKAGLRAGDRIVKLNGKPFFSTWANFAKDLMLTIGEVSLEVVRDGQPRTIRYVPALNPNAPSRLKHEEIAYPFFLPRIPIELYPESGGPAARAGLRKGDVLLAVNGEPVRDYETYQDFLDRSAGAPLRLTVLRAGKSLDFTVASEPIPDLPLDYTRYMFGVRFDVAENAPVVAGLLDFLPARAAGIEIGDKLLRSGDTAFPDRAAVVRFTQAQRGNPFPLTVLRNGVEKTFQITPKPVRPRTIGAAITLRDHPTPFQQFGATLELTWKSLRGMGVWIGNKIGLTQQQSSIKPRHMSAILGMGVTLYTSVKASLIYGIYFVVMISFALAIFNLLPLPVLDGGHISFALIELVFRRPVPPAVVKYLSYVFISLLIAMMVYVSYYDVLRTYHTFAPEAADPPAPAPAAPAPEAKP